MTTVLPPVFKGSDSAAPLKKSNGEQLNVKMGTLLHQMNQLKGQIQAARITTVKEKVEKNAQNLESHVAQIKSLSSKDHIAFAKDNGCGRMLFLKMEHPLCKFTGFGQGAGQKDSINCQEVVTSTCIILPYVDKLPTYTTWIFLERNQRMTEDQSVVGRRQIYYDQHGNEALICSDSEDEVADPEEEKHDFSDGEDRILWTTFQEHGIDDEILNIVNQFIGASISEIQERYILLKEKNSGKVDLDSNKFETDKGLSMEKTLSAALDSFDNLFCRRCLLFDCRLHGCSQSIIYPNEKQIYCSGHEEDRKPCSDRCYLKSIVIKDLPLSIMEDFNGTINDSSDEANCDPSTCNAEKPSGNVITDILGDETSISRQMMPVISENFHSSEIATSSDMFVFTAHHHEAIGKRKPIDSTDPVIHSPLLLSDDTQVCKKQKNISASDVINATGEDDLFQDFISVEKNDHEESGGRQESEFQRTTINFEDETNERASKKFSHSVVASSDESHITRGCEPSGITERPDLKLMSDAIGDKLEEMSDAIGDKLEEMSGSSEWKPMEKELYLKGIEIFGRNSCLITRNLLSGLKTCIEVFCYMRDGCASTPLRSDLAPNLLREDDGKAGTEHLLEMPPRSRLLRRKGKTRKLKYSWKSAGHPSVWKRIADGKNQSCKQYTPCGCLSMCGKQCPCLHNGTCCEKYCGCSKSCKNRFRGCHCAKSQCRSRQCPCFAAGRECDPDVCRNCWVSCGDGSLGKPPSQGDSQCGNMRLLLRQQQRILLAKSDVAGWGAFLKNSVNKNDYLGEYTGELISHREADKRGKIYDRANSSFLFDLNDQYVLDAYRKGDKLKFANHSSNPNCYAKVMLVAGDHRVGIFAKENIDASEELFYDYRYGPDQAPAWARKPGGSKRDDASVPQGRAKKHQSH